MLFPNPQQLEVPMSEPYIPEKDRIDVIGRLTGRLDEDGEESLREKAARVAVISDKGLIVDKPPPKEEGSKDDKDDKEGKEGKELKDNKDFGEKDDKDTKEVEKDTKEEGEKDVKDIKDVGEKDEKDTDKDFKDVEKDDKDSKEVEKDEKDFKDEDKDFPDETKGLIVDAAFDREAPAEPEQETEQERQYPDRPVM
jgi:hypothetical protein